MKSFNDTNLSNEVKELSNIKDNKFILKFIEEIKIEDQFCPYTIIVTEYCGVSKEKLIINEQKT